MRRRLGVVLLLPEPWSTEIQGLRRALGAPSIDTQPPHLTLVPPVNVPEDRIDEAVGVLRRAAARCSPTIDVTVGPPATFVPVSPVVYLSVGGDRQALCALQTDVFAGPLLRRVDYDYEPHVTVCESVAAETARMATSILGRYRIQVLFDRVHLLEQGDDRVWRPLTDVPFGPPVVRGRGGVELHLRWCLRPAPDVVALLNAIAPWTDGRTDRRTDVRSGSVAFTTPTLEARGSRDELVGARCGLSAVVVDEWLGYGVEERLLTEPLPS